jgi:hypothetical protein
MLTPDVSLTAIAATEAALRNDRAGLWALVSGADPAELAAVVLFLAGGLAREMADHHGPEHAGQLLAGARALVLSGWQPPQPPAR